MPNFDFLEHYEFIKNFILFFKFLKLSHCKKVKM